MLIVVLVPQWAALMALTGMDIPEGLLAEVQQLTGDVF
jgi:hypothetical protein